jgi:arylsulfatase A-like enzyme
MKPNIIIFLADDLGYDDLSCYGSRIHSTPNIDALAAHGLRFTDCHSNGCMCSPSRAALLTGRYQQRAGVEYVLGPDPHKTPGMSADELTFAHLFRDAGYATGMFGKYHTGHIPLQSPNRMGFDVFRGQNGGMDHHARFDRWGEGSWYHDETLVEDEEGYSTELIADHALAFISDNRDRPFLCYVADWMVHFPWQGPNDPADFSKGVDNSSPEKKYGSVPDRKRAYREMVEAMDNSVGRIAEQVRKLGLAENTVILFASDNGGHHLVCDNEPLNGHKGSMLEGGHRVPAVAYWPGTITPRQAPVRDTVLLSDLFRTILDIASIEPPAGRRLDSLSLLPLLTEGRALPPRLLFWRQGEQFAVRDGPWKYVVHADGQGLFNLDRDLGETTDLSAAHPERVATMRQAFQAWSEDVEAEARRGRG